MKQFLTRLLYDKYNVTIWFNDPDGNRTGEKWVEDLSHVKKINQFELVGLDMAGKKINIKTRNKFDYFVKKIY
jgi:hypothetical protein